MPQAIAGAQPIKHREQQGKYWVHTTTDGNTTHVYYKT